MEEDEILARIKTIEDVLVRYFNYNSHNIVGGAEEARIEIERLTRYWPTTPPSEDTHDNPA